MDTARTRATRRWKLALPVAVIVAVVAAALAGTTSAGPSPSAKGPRWIDAAAFDTSKPLKDLAKTSKPSGAKPVAGPPGADRGPSVEEGTTTTAYRTPGMQARSAVAEAASDLAPLANFEGISNQDNFNIFGFRVNPPDPVGDVGPNHYVEMVNLAFAVYDKSGNLLLGPVDTGALWSGFAVEDCTDPSGDPIVLYDQFADRWLLSQFSTRGTPYYYDCVAISQTGDPTGAYYRYAFRTQEDTHVPGTYYFPDYPKYGVWKDSYILTTRDFGDGGGYGISAYALEKNKMVNGDPKARAVQFFLDSDFVDLNLIGDGLLPPDVDGKTKPKNDAWAPIVGTQDDDYVYGAPFDALNVFELNVLWNSKPTAAFRLAAQLPVAEFDSFFPCGPSRGCIPQPGITNPDQYVDILSYRQRPTYRLAYRNKGTYETMVTNQSVEASPGMAGVRWYEIRRVNGVYSLFQQGTYAPSDGVHRWMGSIAQDKKGNIALGYSVSNAIDVYPGIRYTGRLAGDPLGQMTLGEGVIVNGSGVQTTTNSRWGDYTSMNVDPVDDCTFWYVNEYYEVSGLPLPLPPPPLPPPGTTAPWQTRIASFKLPGCS
jgi:hypothetical protein